jgi:hypothetical protein
MIASPNPANSFNSIELRHVLTRFSRSKTIDSKRRQVARWH